MSFDKKVKVAVVQAAPVLFNKKLTTEKIIGLIEQASLHNPDLIVFPESFIPAYPRNMIFGTTIGSRSDTGRLIWEKYFNNSVDVPGKESDIIAQAAKKSGAYISMGITEREGKSLYCTQLFSHLRENLVENTEKLNLLQQSDWYGVKATDPH